MRSVGGQTAGWLRRAGFTIIEILIAIVVLVLGITGIVALFPTAIESGNRTVEDTYAATITQSVVDAISMNLRECRYTWTDTAPDPPRVWTYFIFNHDGVLDQAPSEPHKFDTSEKIYEKDYCVVLPQAPTDPNDEVDNEPIFLYPVPAKVDADYRVQPGTGYAKSPTAQRSPTALASPGTLIDNFSVTEPSPRGFMLETADGTPALWIPRVYPLGRYRENEDLGIKDEEGSDPRKGDVRAEFSGEEIITGGTGTATSIALDPYPTYSFAFAIKRARVDSDNNGIITQDDYFSNSLYELRVMIFKNFDPEIAKELDPGATGTGPVVPKTNVPIRTFITLISI